jgi:putative exporter of polyketide antibiotics
MANETIEQLIGGIELIVVGLGSFLLGSLQADITYGIAQFVLGALNTSGSLKGSLGAVKTAGTVISGLFSLLGIVFTVAGAYLVVKAVRDMAENKGK